MRRFIVVRQDVDRRSATCLPIFSHSGNGQEKGGMKREAHGFIYSRRKPQKVPSMCCKALRVKISENGQDLTDPSLVHYGKVYTIEANWRVKNIGVLDDDSIKTLRHYWRKILGFVNEDLPEPSMTPRAKEAAIAYFGLGIDSYPSTTTSQQPFASISAPVGYPPPITRSYGGHRGFAEPYQPQSTLPASGRGEHDYHSVTNASSYGMSSHHASDRHRGDEFASYPGTSPAQGAACYQGHSMPMAPSRTLSTVSYASQGPSTTDYHVRRAPVTSNTSTGLFALETQIHSASEMFGGVVSSLAEGSSKSKYGSKIDHPNKVVDSRVDFLSRQDNSANTKDPENAEPTYNAQNTAATEQSPHQLAVATNSPKDLPSSPKGASTLSLDATFTPPDIGGPSQINCDCGRAAVSDEQQAASRSSSLSSVSTLAFSENSRYSSSSLNSFGSQSDISERLFRVLRCDDELQALFMESLAKVQPHRFEENLRRCLEQFSVHLREEGGSSPLDRKAVRAARVVRSLSRSTTYETPWKRPTPSFRIMS